MQQCEEAPIVDLINDGTTPASLPLRSSDHDGLVHYLTTDQDGDGVADSLEYCPGATIPESVPTIELGTNRWALVDDDGIFDTSPPNGLSTGSDRRFTITNTAGYVREQIIDQLLVGTGHTKFGCSTGAILDWIEEVQD